MDARSVPPWQTAYSPADFERMGMYPIYQNSGAFPGSPGRSMGDYQVVPGAEMTQYPGSSSMMQPFGTQAPSPFFPMQQGPAPFASMSGMPAGGSMRYYDTRVEARVPAFNPAKVERQPDSPRSDSEYFDRGTSAKPSRSSQARRGGRGGSSPPSARLLVGVLCGLVAVLAVALAVYTAWSCYNILSSDGFLAFSALASDGLPILQSAVWAFMVLACCVLLAAAILGCLAGAAPKRGPLQAFAMAIATLGAVLLLAALIVWMLTSSAQLKATRSANIICQDVRTWGCQPDGVAPGTVSRLLQEAGQQLQSIPEFLRGGSLRPDHHPGVPGGAARRLEAARTAMDYVSSVSSPVNASAGGEPSPCDAVKKLCVPPIGFDAAMACVCSGFWRQPSGSSSGTTLGPWNGTEGAFCAAWNSSLVPWCFVAPENSCKSPPVSTLIDGKEYYQSSGPCGSQVDSRSQLVVDGYDALCQLLVLPALLGLATLLLAGVVFSFSRVPAPQPKISSGADSDNELDVSTATTPGWDDKAKTLDARFQKAQKEATRRLRNETPEEVKLLLYGFYDQAKYGDCRGDRPGFFNKRERAKWDAWNRLRGMSKEEAMEGYIKATGLIE